MLSRLVLAGLSFCACANAIAQVATWKPGPCRPISERNSEMGCWIAASEVVGRMPAGQVFWHISVYPNRTEATAAKRDGETIIESLGKIWLVTIADAAWQPRGGERIAMIGPLPVKQDRQYTAQYMEAIFPAGFDTTVHRHSGPEAWYTVAGQVCLETPSGKAVGGAGERNGVVVPGDVPMRLSVIGTDLRRSLVLILHDSAQPHTTLAPDWTPKGLCRS